MKTVTCDICHKTHEQIEREGHFAGIHRYTKTRQGHWWQFENPVVDEFDICNLCLEAIHKARQEGGVSNETD